MAQLSYFGVCGRLGGASLAPGILVLMPNNQRWILHALWLFVACGMLVTLVNLGLLVALLCSSLSSPYARARLSPITTAVRTSLFPLALFSIVSPLLLPEALRVLSNGTPGNAQKAAAPLV